MYCSCEIVPESICEEGRPSDYLDLNGTMDGVYLQAGPTPDTYYPFLVPNKRLDAIRKHWVKNNCANGKGMLLQM